METPYSKEGKYYQHESDYKQDSLFDITPDFERFNGCNDIFARAQWDPRIQSIKALKWFKGMLGYNVNIKTTDGYTQKDYALRNAGWVLSNLMMERSMHMQRRDGFLDDIREYMRLAATKVEVTSTADMSAEIKQAGKIFGADMVGITPVDLRWHYTHRFDADTKKEKPNDLPEGVNNCIVIGTEMSYELIKTYPSALASTAPALGYSKDTFILMTLAQFIRNLGYQAVASLNDSAQAIPYAIQAGLAEYGRNGLAITKEFGPRVRFGKIFTDLPLDYDLPVKFGVKEFCDICSKCADACPAKAIPYGEPNDKILNQSNIIGVKKWTVDAEKCFNIWTNQGTECGICIRVCPYNKSHKTLFDRLYYRFFKWLAFSPAKKLALYLDNKLGFGKRKQPSSWWKTRPE
ncbi:MAG: reductive dehalogenase [Chitinophagales bacterium]